MTRRLRRGRACTPRARGWRPAAASDGRAASQMESPDEDARSSPLRRLQEPHRAVWANRFESGLDASGAFRLQRHRHCPCESASTKGLAGAGRCLDSRGLPPGYPRSLACLIETGFRGLRQGCENFFDPGVAGEASRG